MQFSVTPALTSTQWMKYLPKSNASVNLVFVSFSIPFQLNCCFSLVFFPAHIMNLKNWKKNATRLRHVQLNFIRKLARNWNGCTFNRANTAQKNSLIQCLGQCQKIEFGHLKQFFFVCFVWNSNLQNWIILMSLCPIWRFWC